MNERAIDVPVSLATLTYLTLDTIFWEGTKLVSVLCLAAENECARGRTSEGTTNVFNY